MKTKPRTPGAAPKPKRAGPSLSVPRLKRAMKAQGVGFRGLQGALVSAGVGGRLEDWLSGRCGPSVPALAVLARALNVKMEDLIRE